MVGGGIVGNILLTDLVYYSRCCRIRVRTSCCMDRLENIGCTSEDDVHVPLFMDCQADHELTPLGNK